MRISSFDFRNKFARRKALLHKICYNLNVEIKPKLAVTGYRGIWGESLSEQISFEYARGYAKMIASLSRSGKKKVLIGRDARKSGIKIFGSVSRALEKENIEIVNAGIIPTPSVLLLVKKLNFDGGVMITASHNPPEYNGIKFIVSPGRLTNEEEVTTIEKFRKNLTAEEKTTSISKIKEKKIDNTEFRKIHIDEIIKNIDADMIRNKRFKVALDPINGAGSIIAKELLEELGCEVYEINEMQDGTFAHEPEPLPKNLGQIAETTLESKSDIGFALDPDADRLVAVSELGQVISEEHTLALVVKNVLSKEPGDIVINIASSRTSEDVARTYGHKTFKTKVGEANVLSKMLEIGAPVGGEGGGGAIYPKINTSRDGLVCMGLILELMAKENKKISEIVETLPRYVMRKEKIPVVEKADVLFEKLKKVFPEARLTEIDGVRFDWPDLSWLSVRASITEPIIRIFGEAKTEERINSLFQTAMLTLNQK